MGKLIMINKIKNKFIKQNKGQIAIAVLLFSAIVLTLGLSASRKSVTDIKINTDEESLKEAFNTAESGINNYLNGSGNTYEAGDGTVATINSSIIGNSNNLSSEGKILNNDNQLFWLVNHESDGSVGTSYYSSGSISLDVDSGFSGALKIDYYYFNGTYQVQRLGCNYGGSGLVNGFSSDTSNCYNLTLTGSPLLLVVTPIGSPTSLTISGSSAFPQQGEELTAIGTTDNNIKTQIKTRHIYQIPSFFLESITAKNIIQ
jgi:uncharacterized protein (UPF0333 family)